jgi:predicted RNA binding protein YcfA (HicA-like mRNA interferase family)
VQFSSDAGPRIWSSFPNAFHPFRTRNGRVNFLVHRDSNLAKRLRLSGRFFRYKDVKRQVEEVAGCTFIETKGSHVHFRAPHGGRVTIPRHGGDLKIGTLASIVRQTGVGLNVHEFMKAEPGRT